MTEPSATWEELRDLDVCDDGLADARSKMGDDPVTVAGTLSAGVSLDDAIVAIDSLAACRRDIAERRDGFRRDCAAHVLHIFEAQQPDDDRPRRVIIAPGDATRGAALAAAWAAARNAAWAAAEEAAGAAPRGAAGDAAWAAARAAAGDSAEEAAREAALAAAWAAAWDAAGTVAWTVTGYAAWEAAGAAAWDVEKDWQRTRLLAWFSDTLPEPWPLPDETGGG